MRYINPGFAEFLDVEGGTTVEGTKFNPDNGVALYQPKDNDGLDISMKTAPIHFYAKFDVYIPPWSEMSDGIIAKVGFYSNHSGYIGFCGWQLRKYSSDLDPQVIIGNGSSYDKYVEYKVGGALKFGEVNSFWMHFKARSTSAADGEYQVYMNGEKIMENTQKYIYMDAISKLVIYATPNYGKCYLSNIIMTFDEEISLKEKIQAVRHDCPGGRHISCRCRRTADFADCGCAIAHSPIWGSIKGDGNSHWRQTCLSDRRGLGTAYRYFQG